ncbi:hypothetical protein FHQ18_09930 [Deferribacter autotrophicus]|uniref:AAA+ ATPase domain-containing protein n=1 Tax=Deferribacter autotrophicus TaxID=500465 RepID=A0A5A8F056_9BACT|nr:AAA family ATPase [Deferribacter autotrophicus]KAA0257356.1 hypothetical protein FHQ18_09930 [Deferribacter autotrophicus]
MSVYKEFFNFIDDPFKLTPDPDYFYCSSSHEEAINLIEYSISTRKGFMALIGEVGTGKTTLTRVLINSLENVETSLVLNPFLNSEEMLRYICSDFGIILPDKFDKGKVYELLTKFLVRLYEEGKNALVIIDEAQNLSFETMELIRQLSNIEKEDAKLLQILFVGQPEFLEVLNKHELRQLKQRISVIIQLKPLNEEDLENYVNYRIQKASKYHKILFSKEAIKLLYDLTQGNPREINKICEYALIAAYNEQNKKITKKHIEKAFKEISPTHIIHTKTFEPDHNTKKLSLTLITFLLLVFLSGIIVYFIFLQNNKPYAERKAVIYSSSVENFNIKPQLDNKTVTNDNKSDNKSVQKEKVKINLTTDNNTKATLSKNCIHFLVNQKLRKSPSLKSKSNFTIPKNSIAEIIEKRGNWAKISIDNKIGWVLIYNKYNSLINCENK